MSDKRLLAALVAAAWLWGCGGGTPEPAEPPAKPAGESAEPGCADMTESKCKNMQGCAWSAEDSTCKDDSSRTVPD